MQPESQRAIWDMSVFSLPNLNAMAKPPLLVLGAEKDVLMPAFLVQSTARTYGVPDRIFRGMGHGVMLERLAARRGNHPRLAGRSGFGQGLRVDVLAEVGRIVVLHRRRQAASSCWAFCTSMSSTFFRTAMPTAVPVCSAVAETALTSIIEPSAGRLIMAAAARK